MFLAALLSSVTQDTVGTENSIRAVGSREPPAKMAVQIAIEGAASVRIQGRVSRAAPWMDLGAPYTLSALIHIEPVQFLRAVASGMGPGASVSAWAAWGW